MTHRIIEGVLNADVPDAGTFTVNYPPSSDEGNFYRAVQHKLVLGQNSVFEFPQKFGVTLGTANITITNKTGATLLAGTPFKLQLEERGRRAFRDPDSKVLLNRTAKQDVFDVNLGAPDAAVATGVTTAQLLGGAGPLTIDGTLAAGGVATLDVPRNVTLTVATTNQSGITFTITGFDEYGVAMKETMAGPNANTVQGKKAFKRVTGVAANNAIATNGVSVGFGDVLGLPVFIPAVAYILKEVQDGAVASAGTFVGGDQTAGGNTGASGDIRGTYDPSAACDADKVFSLTVALHDPTYLGMPQFA